MINFLTKLSRSAPVLDVTLLTPQGDLLFYRHSTQKDAIESKKISIWRKITSSFATMQQADFCFANGHYYIITTGIGYLIIGITGREKLKEIKAACQNVQEKLSSQQPCKKILLKMLADTDPLFKPDIVKTLITYMDHEVAARIAALLQEDRICIDKDQANLLLVTCQALGHCASHEAIDSLKNLLSKHESQTLSLSPTVTQAAKRSLQQLAKTKIKGVKSQQNQDQGQGSVPPQTAAPELSHSTLPKGSQIIALAQGEEKREAVTLTMQLIKQHVQKNQFDIADQYRDLLMEVDSSALMEIIQAAELLEHAKKAAIPDTHFAVWKNLLETLTMEEFTSLYHGMQHKTYPNNATIVETGQRLSALFFIDDGHVQLFAQSNNRQIPLARLSKGQIFGTETFFEVSVWTIQAVSQGARISLLSHKKLHELKDRDPGLSAKLRTYCTKSQTTSSLFKKTHQTRREFQRKKASGIILFTVLDKTGKERSADARGTLLDISKGGLAFSLHTSQKRNATNLFGQKIKVKFIDSTDKPASIYDGTIMAVREFNLLGKEYSIHIKCDKRVNLSAIRQMSRYKVEH
jgi:CRP-like cAMP-binding protein